MKRLEFAFAMVAILAVLVLSACSEMPTGLSADEVAVDYAKGVAIGSDCSVYFNKGSKYFHGPADCRDEVADGTYYGIAGRANDTLKEKCDALWPGVGGSCSYSWNGRYPNGSGWSWHEDATNTGTYCGVDGTIVAETRKSVARCFFATFVYEGHGSQKVNPVNFK